MPLWKDGRFTDDTWTIVPDDAPVPGEGNTSNNKATYPVIFSLG